MLDTTATANINHKTTPLVGAKLVLVDELIRRKPRDNGNADFMRLTKTINTYEEEPHFVLGYN